MTAVLAGLFTSAIELHGPQRFFLMFPLCLAIAIVYKTIRLDDLRELPKAAAVLWVTIVIGMCVVGGGLWLAFELLV